MNIRQRSIWLIAITATVGIPGLFSSGLSAQESTSREVVQPLPSKDVQSLNRALLSLANRPKDVDALLKAGEAAVQVDDLDAAIGFYRRADTVSPNNARTKLGMANVFLRSGRPVAALSQFYAAESAGAKLADFLSSRGLAFDMVGDATKAQADYQRAISLNKNDIESKRRLALSYAISGNRAGFEEVLRPLLEKRDFASFRTRAFGLAIMGEQDRATAIVDAVMPRDLAVRITPYLAYMPQLTKAQQAAAANLGIFPEAADIGRDDPQIAAYVSSEQATGRNADANFGGRLAPVGAPLDQPVQASRVIPDQPAPVLATPPADLTAQAGADPVQPTPASPVQREERLGSVADAFADFDSAALPDVAVGDNAVNIAAIEIPREAEPDAGNAEPELIKHPSRIWVQVATGRDLSALKFDWRRILRTAPELLKDLTPHVTPWGQANRLLAGPLETRASARDLINALKLKGIDTFRFTSPEGIEVKELK